MQTDEHGITICVCQGRTIVVRRIRIVVARHDDAIAQPLKFRAQCSRELQHHIFLRDAARSARAGIGAPVAWIEHNHRTKMYGRRRRCLGGRNLLRRRFGR